MKTVFWQLALAAAHRGEPVISVEDLARLVTAVQTQVVERLRPSESWALLSEGLMAPHPGHFLLALRRAGALRRWLPEVEALWGVPQLSDEPTPVDLGQHLVPLLEETARVDAPLAVRLAALTVNLGKPGTPREIWPSHYKHEERGHALLQVLQVRLDIPPPLLELAHLATDELERVHRASDLRAGAIAAMLQRLQAQQQPERFEQLLLLCTCDFAAYAGHRPEDYPKAPRLRQALAAYRAEPVDGLDEDEALSRRAQAVHRALRGASAMASGALGDGPRV